MQATNHYLATLLGERVEKLRTKLGKAWESDPTVLASFDSEIENLWEAISVGEIPSNAHWARAKIKAIFEELLPPNKDVKTGNIPTKDARRAPSGGQHYRSVGPGLWKAIDYADVFDCSPLEIAVWLAEDARKEVLAQRKEQTVKELGPLPENLPPHEHAELVASRAIKMGFRHLYE